MVSDHLQPWRHVGGHAPNALACLAAIGERTERVRPRHERADAVVPLQPGRARPAVRHPRPAQPGPRRPRRRHRRGPQRDVASASPDWPDFKERFARLREAVRLMRALWADERVTFDGDYYRTDDATIYDRPEGGVPIYVAAGGPGDGQVRRPGRRRLHLHQRQGHGPLHRQAAARRRRRAVHGATARRRDRPDDRDQAAPTPRPARRRSRTPASGLRSRSAPRTSTASTTPSRWPTPPTSCPSRRSPTRWIVATTPEGVVDAVRPYVEAGFDHLVFHAPGHDQEAFLTSFGRDVLPLLRQL